MSNPPQATTSDYNTFFVAAEHVSDAGHTLIVDEAGNYYTTHPHVAQLVVKIVRGAEGVVESVEELAEDIKTSLGELIDKLEATEDPAHTTESLPLIEGLVEVYPGVDDEEDVHLFGLDPTEVEADLGSEDIPDEEPVEVGSETDDEGAA